MQLTKYTDFALRTLIFLGIQPAGERVTITQVSEHFEIPRNHLIKIVHHLAKEGFIDSVRGKGGGIKLGLPAEEINLRDLIQATEETLRPVNCAHPRCPIVGHCGLRGILFDAQEAFLNELSKHSLADLCGPERGLTQLLHLKQSSPVRAQA